MSAATADYAALAEGIRALFRARGELDGWHITLEPEPSTTEQCPALCIQVAGFNRVAARMARVGTGGSPYNETITVGLRIVQFSGQGAADARRLRDEGVQTVIKIVDGDPDLRGSNPSGLVLWADVLAGRFDTSPATAGIFATAELDLVCVLNS